jgi:ABC-type multidrug transport system ATPase subunit
MIEIRDVGVVIRGCVILGSITACFPAATTTLVTGEAGAGKTTLLRAIAGIQKHSGSIRFDGAHVDQVRDRLYACPSGAPVSAALTGYDNVRLLLGRDLSDAHIASVAPALADDVVLRRRALALSRGQRVRLHLVAALASAARYLVFDEALTGPDAPTASEIGDEVHGRSPEATVVLAGSCDPTGGAVGARRMTMVDGALVESRYVGITTRTPEVAPAAR